MSAHNPAPPASSLGGLGFALSFLSRLGPPRPYSPQAVAASLFWFPAVGLLIGLCQGLPLIVPGSDALGGGRGWLYVALGWWVTRGLHWDGLLDVADAWGSGAVGERFWEICKDSRVGAFGVAAAVVSAGAIAACTNECLNKGLALPLLLAPLFGRAVAVACALIAKPLARPGMAATFLQAATPKCVVLAGSFSIAACVLAGYAGALLWAAILTSFAAWRILVLGKRVGGFNGDFLGAVIVLGELAFLCAALLSSGD